jgi:hypothetical protein
LLGIGVIAALVVGFQVAAFAVHNTGAFELDGNANSSAAPGDDWDSICKKATSTLPVAQQLCTTAPNPSATNIAASFVTDGSGSASIFTGGGSKDPIDINQWASKNTGGLPDKDNLVHGFAARYSLPASTSCPVGGTPNVPTCELLYFGSDRFANDGDAVQGFWFFQNKIQPGTNSIGGGTGFTGVHKNGDILVLSDFSNGGDTSTINVYKWDSTCPSKANNDPQPGQCGDTNLRLIESSTSANCADLPSGANDADDQCGIVNEDTIIQPWPFVDKTPTSTDFPANSALAGEFFEGGINLNALGLAGACFSSVASESRASTSTDATLKDLVLGQLQQCNAGLTTEASNSTATVAPGTSITDTATVSVSGGTNAPDPTGNVTFFLCGPSATGACTTGGTQIPNAQTTVPLVPGTANDGKATATSAAVAPTDPGTYCFRATWPGDTNYPGALSHTNTNTTGTGHECFTVQGTSGITTAQSWLPNDTATVTSGSGGTAPTGSVKFELFESNDCTGTSVYDITDSSVPYETANTTAYTTDKVISWKATFTPDNANVTGSNHCETSTLDITN